MTFKLQAVIVVLGACITAPAAAHDFPIAATMNTGFLMRMGGAYARDKAIEFMFAQSAAQVNGTEIVNPADQQPSLVRQMANVLAGINLGVTLWTMGAIGLKKSLELEAGSTNTKFFDQSFDRGMDMFVLMEAARDNYKAIRAIADEAQAPKIIAPEKSTAVQTYFGGSMIPAYLATHGAGAVASYYSFVFGAKLGAKVTKNPLAFSLVLWNVGISLCMSAHAAYNYLADAIGLTTGCTACDAIYSAAEQNAYIATGIIPGLWALWKFQKEHSKKAA